MINKATEIVPDVLAKELLRLARQDRRWVQFFRTGQVDHQGYIEYSIRCAIPTWTRGTWRSAADGFGMWALSLWLVDGPKTFRPKVQQCEVMEQVEVNLEIGEYGQPYPCLLVELPVGKYTPFRSVLVHHSPEDGLITCQIISDDHLNDIVVTVATGGQPIEVSLQRFDDDLANLAALSGKVLRIALNCCLALVNFGSRKELLMTKHVESERRLVQRGGEAGERARQRLKDNPPVQLISFEREVVLHDTRDEQRELGESTGREMTSHWRRGHWKMQACGKGWTERKRIFVRPVLVRADRFVGDTSETTTTYKG